MPKRIVFPEKGQVELQDFELPVMNPTDIQVRTLYSLMSIGTETTILHQKYAPDTHYDRVFSFPQLKTGVQAVAEVESVGSAVAQRIAIWPTGPAPMIKTDPIDSNRPAHAARYAVFARPHQHAFLRSIPSGTGEQSASGITWCEPCAIRMKILSPT